MSNADWPGFSWQFDALRKRKDGTAKERAPYLVDAHSYIPLACSKNRTERVQSFPAGMSIFF
jgi:hypothetical protein